MQPTNLEELQDAIIAVWIQIMEERFQNIAEFMPRRTEVVLKTKQGPIWYLKHIITKLIS